MFKASPSDARTHYWREQVEAWKRSGQSQRTFCRTHDLDYYRFGYWRKKFRQAAAEIPTASSSGGFVSVISTTETSHSELSVTLANGAVVNGISSRNLDTACQLLARLS